MRETLAHRRTPWSLLSHGEGDTSTRMGWRRRPTRTGATQVPLPPSGLALRPPPRSGFVQWPFCRLRSVDTARVDVAIQARVRIDAVLQVGDADHDVVDAG